MADRVFGPTWQRLKGQTGFRCCFRRCCACDVIVNACVLSRVSLHECDLWFDRGQFADECEDPS